MTVESFQKEIVELTKRKEAFEKKLLQAQTERNVHLNTLKSEFGITEDQLEAKIKELNDQVAKIEETISDKLEELKEYVKNLEKVLTNG